MLGLKKNPTLAQAEADAPKGTEPSFQTWLLAAALALVTVVLYWPATHNAFVGYDDDTYVTSNFHVRNGINLADVIWVFGNPVCFNWHPLTMLSHMLDCQLYGLKPWGHHLTSILLHAINAVLVFLLLRRLTGATWRSAWVAAFFAWHPIHVESVAWVAERKDVLSACFGFLALLFYVRHAQAGQEAGNKDPDGAPPAGAAAFYHSTSYWLAWGFFGLGLLSKPMLVTWPFVMLLLDFWPLRRLTPDHWQGTAIRRLLIEKIPFIALAAAASVLTFIVQRQGGAVAGLEILPVGMRGGNAIVSYGRYLEKIFWPVDLAVFYPHPGYWPLGLVLLSGAVLAGVSVLFWFKRRGCPYLLTGWLFYCGTLVPVIGLVQVGGQSMADRYVYIPLLGVLILAVWGAHAVAWNRRYLAMPVSIAGFMAVVFCLALTRQQIRHWQDGETLFRHTLEVTKRNFVALNGLGVALFVKGQNDAASSQFQEAIRLNPNYAEPHNNLGNLLAMQGRTGEAINQFQEAIRLQPEYAYAHFNLGNALLNLGQPDAAISQFQEALRLAPDDGEAHYKLGNLLAAKGRIDEAILQFREALRFQPDSADAHNNLGNLLSEKGRVDAAVRQFQEALRLKPNFAEAHYNFGIALVKQGRVDEAISQFQAATRLTPDFAPAHYYLGVALSRKGRADEAINELQEALRRKPDYAIAHNRLGAILGEDGQTDAAIIHFEEALRLKPDYPEARTNLARALEMKNAPAGR